MMIQEPLFKGPSYNKGRASVCFVSMFEQKSDAGGDEVEISVENQAFMDDFFTQVGPLLDLNTSKNPNVTCLGLFTSVRVCAPLYVCVCMGQD